VQAEGERAMKVRDAALLRTEKVEKQKAEVEAARDTLKCVFSRRRRRSVLDFSLTVMVTQLLSHQHKDNSHCTTLNASNARHLRDLMAFRAGRTWRA